LDHASSIHHEAVLGDFKGGHHILLDEQDRKALVANSLQSRNQLVHWAR
jgi:hypothetical protein